MNLQRWGGWVLLAFWIQSIVPCAVSGTIPILSLDEEAEDLEEPNRVYQAPYQTSVRAVTTAHVSSSVRTLSVSVTT